MNGKNIIIFGISCILANVQNVLEYNEWCILKLSEIFNIFCFLISSNVYIIKKVKNSMKECRNYWEYVGNVGCIVLNLLWRHSVFVNIAKNIRDV